MRVRIRFEKTGIMRYVGHLDLMRFFQKAVKRSNLPIRYSEGFNPHQIMSFASPLGVGLTSEGEYMDIDLKEQVDAASALKALNDNMVEGLDGRMVSTSEDAKARRNAMDERGTFQSDVVLPLMDTINPDSDVKHDGHFGKTETRFDHDNSRPGSGS